MGTSAAVGPKISSGGDIALNRYVDDGNIAELIAYSSELTSSERTRVENYLNAKYDTGTIYQANPVLNATDLQLWLAADRGISATGNAAQFVSASSQRLLHSDSVALSTGDIDFSLCAWSYLASKGADRPVAAKWNNTSSGLEYWIGYLASSDRFALTVSPDGINSTGQIVANSLGSPSVNTWYFICAIHDAVNDTISIQVNNGTVDSATYSSGVADGPSDFNIGSNVAAFFDGRIADVGFWKKVLTTTEKTQLFNSGRGLDFGSLPSTLSDGTLVEYWNLDEDSGNRSSRAGAGSTLTDTNSVLAGAFSGQYLSSWQDQSGNGNNAVNTSGTFSLALRWINSTAFLNKPILRFDGSSQYLTSSFSTSMRSIGDRDAFTVIAALRPNSTGSSAQPLIGTESVATPDLLVKLTSALKFQVYGSQSASTSAAQTTALSSTTASIVSISDDSTNSLQFFLNGAADGTDTHITYGIANSSFNIGRSNTDYFSGDLAELIVYSRGLSAVERQSIECYLSGKYGITLSGVTCN